MIVGIDEVGRGSWAGPLVVGAVVMGGETIEGLTDSKKLTAKKRETLSLQIKQTARGIGIGWVSAKIIDQIGISKSLTLATQRALAGVNCEYDQIIIDGTVKLIDDPRVTTMKQADLLVPSVSAASIIAKVARDSYMHTIAESFPGYGFEKHVGYGTSAHQSAITQLGVSPLHRMSFAPMKTMDSVKPAVKREPTMGELAEQVAAEYLMRQGYRIIDRNWKTKWCEIDIIARSGEAVHFIEVKYRKTNEQGDGLEYVTTQKQRQMRFAAELWLSNRSDYDTVLLSAMSLSGQPAVVERFVEQI